MGRRALLNPDRQAAVVAEILATGRQEHAARAAGIGESTHYAWLDRGRRALARARPGHPPAQRERPFVEYLEAVEGARRQWEREILTSIHEVATVGVPYETVREKVERRPGANEGDPEIEVVVERVTTRGARRDWKAGTWLLQRARPDEYGDKATPDGLSPEEEARLVGKAIEGALTELGVKLTPAAREVVGRHLEIVVTDAARAAS